MAADVVLEWNTILCQALRDGTLPGPGWSSRNAAIVETAVFDAVNSIEKDYAPYLSDYDVPAGTSERMRRRPAARAWWALRNLYPEQSTRSSISTWPTRWRMCPMGRVKPMA